MNVQVEPQMLLHCCIRPIYRGTGLRSRGEAFTCGRRDAGIIS
jgi:hypothetical protein